MKTLKTTARFSTVYHLVKASMVFLFITALTLSACQKDKDSVAPSVPFEGRYEATSSSKTYIMTIEKKGGANFQIKNFGGFLNVPLNATAAGNSLTIPTQTFTNSNGKQLILSGSGTLNNVELTLQYSVRGFTQYDADVVAKRKAE